MRCIALLLVLVLAASACSSSAGGDVTTEQAAPTVSDQSTEPAATTPPVVAADPTAAPDSAVATVVPEPATAATAEPQADAAQTDAAEIGTGATSTFVVDVWADNWFALYIDGVLVAEDSVPITTERSFNKETFTFEATYPFTVAIEAKDFRETDSGIEYIGLNNQQMGDGGIIAQITDDATGQVVAVTTADWQAFVVHRAPLNPECERDVDPDATCLFEINDVDTSWTAPGFDDSAWFAATEWSEAAVSPKDGYDQVSWDPSAQLIWGADLEVDNTILLRATVGADGILPVVNANGDATSSPVGCIIAVGTATVDCTDDAIIVESNGLPTHPIMVGIANGGWNGQWPKAQDYTAANAFVIPTDVTLADDPALAVMNATGVTANGIPFFFPHAPGRAGSAECIDLPAEILPEGECMRDPVLAGEMDICGGHVGRGDDYHYHATPTCLLDELADGDIVGYMLDGIPMYAEPIEGSVPFDSCSGWLSPDGLLHYAFQTDFPYLTSCMLGEFAEGPRTQGSQEYTGGLDTRNVGSIASFEIEDGCQIMTFSNGAELRHCD